MKHCYQLFVICFLINTYCTAQNLVVNGDFEQYAGCPSDYSQIDSSGNWFSPTAYGTPDYYNSCSTGNAGVPANGTGYQPAHSGNGYSGFYLYNNAGGNVREYVETALTTPLTANTTYHLDMYFNLTNYCAFTTDAIGVYFSDTLVDGITAFGNLTYTAQIVNTAGNFPDTLNWTLVSGNYTAHGGERYILIGNFKDDAHTTAINWSTNIFDFTYVLLDDVSLTPLTGLGESDGMKASVYPNPFSEHLTYTTNKEGVLKFSIFDVTGRLILEEDFARTIRLNTEKFVKGIYIYEVRDNAGIMQMGKILKE